MYSCPRHAQLALAALVNLLELTRNFGKEAAMLAGLDHVCGEFAAAVLFLGGIKLIGIGVLGDYIGRIYVEAKGRPHYFIRAIHNS